MVIFSVIVHKENLAEKVMHLVLENKYAKSVQLDSEQKNFYDEHGKLEVKQTTKLSFLTKALLYKEIESRLIQEFGDAELVIYSVPISQMNEKYMQQLRSFIKST